MGNSFEIVQNSKNELMFDISGKKSTQGAFEFIMNVSLEWLNKTGKISLGIAKKYQMFN
jgi:hypothetical protein